MFIPIENCDGHDNEAIIKIFTYSCVSTGFVYMSPQTFSLMHNSSTLPPQEDTLRLTGGPFQMETLPADN